METVTKEAIFKAYGLGALDFRRHLIVPYVKLPDRAIEKSVFILKEKVNLQYQLFCEKI